MKIVLILNICIINIHKCILLGAINLAAKEMPTVGTSSVTADHHESFDAFPTPEDSFSSTSLNNSAVTTESNESSCVNFKDR